MSVGVMFMLSADIFFFSSSVPKYVYFASVPVTEEGASVNLTEEGTEWPTSILQRDFWNCVLATIQLITAFQAISTKVHASYYCVQFLEVLFC